jgi:hypothetical protein
MQELWWWLERWWHYGDGGAIVAGCVVLAVVLLLQRRAERQAERQARVEMAAAKALAALFASDPQQAQRLLESGLRDSEVAWKVLRDRWTIADAVADYARRHDS